MSVRLRPKWLSVRISLVSLKEPKPKKKKIQKHFLILKQKLKIQSEIGDEVKIGDSVTPFKSMGKSPTIYKTASDFDNANFKVKQKLEILSSKEFTMQTSLDIFLELWTWSFRE